MLTALRNGSTCSPAKGTPVNRLFERFFEDGFFAPVTAAVANRSVAFWEDEHGYTIEIDAPGVTDKDVELSMHNGELAIQWERKPAEKEGGYDPRHYGRFEQRVKLPGAIDADRIEAKLANGVLTLAIPKSEAAKPRKIAVQVQ